MIIQTDASLAGWGSSLQQGSNIRAMFNGRANLTHECVGTTSNKTDSIFLHQREKSESHTLSDRQQGSLVLTFENGRTKKEHMVKSSREIWHYLLNHNMSITVEYLSSVLNTVADRASRKKTNSSKWHFSFQSFSSGFSTTWFSNNRSICFPPMPSTTSIYNLTFWFVQSGDRCNDTKFEQRSSLYISLF